MRRLSSRGTFFTKRVFPVLWFGFLILFIGMPYFLNGNGHSPLFFPFIVIPLAMTAFGFFIMKKLVFDLVDEVWEDGDSLLVKNRGQEERIPLSNIKNVSYSPYMNPPRVTLSLRTPSMFGDQITFGAPIRLIPFSTSPMINDLIERVDAARQKHT
jgi:hypothetical protein